MVMCTATMQKNMPLDPPKVWSAKSEDNGCTWSFPKD